MGRYTPESKIRDLLKDERVRQIAEAYVPGILSNSQLPLVLGLRAKKIIGKGRYVGLTPEQEEELIAKVLALE